MILGHPNPWEKAYDPVRTPHVSKKVGEKMGEETSYTIHVSQKIITLHLWNSFLGIYYAI